MGLKSRRRGLRPRVIALACCGVLAAAWLTPGPAARAGPTRLAHAPPFRRALGQQELASPGGVAADPAGGIWAADTGHNRVVEFTPSGRLAAAFGQNLDQPAGIATDAAGHVWVADTGHDRVVEFSSAGRVLASFGSPAPGRRPPDRAGALAGAPV